MVMVSRNADLASVLVNSNPPEGFMSSARTPPPAFPFLQYELVKEQKRRQSHRARKPGFRDSEALLS